MSPDAQSASTSTKSEQEPLFLPDLSSDEGSGSEAEMAKMQELARRTIDRLGNLSDGHSEDGDSDVDPDALQEAMVAMFDEKALDKRFSRKQLLYLLSRKEEYRHATLKQRPHIARAAGTTILNSYLKIFKKKGLEITLAQRKNILAVRLQWCNKYSCNP